MKYKFVLVLLLIMRLSSFHVFSQTESDSTLLGLPGDNLNLYAVLDLFQKSKTIEEFEKSLNLETSLINNLDLDLDGKVDFIKVVTQQNDDDFTFILQVAVTEKETQDVAVIFVSKDKDKKITMQIVGDVDLYGKDYIVEPKTTTTPSVTANPGYQGEDPVVVNVPASTTTVVVESAPIVQYVYSPAYVPYVPPYYYGYYPPYYAAFSVMAVGMYWGLHASYYHGGYGYHGNTTVIHNTNNFNNYNNHRNSSNTVNHNRANGNYSGNRAGASTRPAGGASASTRPAGGASASTRPAGGASASTRPAGGASASTRPAGGASGSTRQSGGVSPSTRQSGAASASTRQSSSGNYSRPSGTSNSYSGGGRSSSGYSGSSNRSSSGYSGGGRSSSSYSGGGGGRSGGGYSGGGGRGGGRR